MARPAVVTCLAALPRVSDCIGLLCPLPRRGACLLAPPWLKIYPLVTLLYRPITISSDTRVWDDRALACTGVRHGWYRPVPRWRGLLTRVGAGAQFADHSGAGQCLGLVRPDRLLQQVPLAQLTAPRDQQPPPLLAPHPLGHPPQPAPPGP